MNRSSIGNISNRPASMSNISTYLENPEKKAKFPLGPTNDSPGPMLFSVANTDVTLVSAPKLSSETSRMDTTAMAA